LKKKKQKTFDLRGICSGRRDIPGGLYFLTTGLQRPQEQKFFASFFQKRSSCLAIAVLRFLS
jgi:hypothetical protein